ncbi:hypothetical protein KAR48_13185 [bacterium]|nr:hypothetical protein [bacterium]
MRRITSILILLVLLSTGSAVASDKLGGNGLIYVNSAQNISAGHLQLFAGTRFFGKIMGGNYAYTLWNVQGFTALTWGVNSNLEFTFAPIVYQDTNNSEGNSLDGAANAPDDIFLKMKMGNFHGDKSPWYMGGQLGIRIPTAEAHNIIFEPYSAGGLEIGVTGLLSYFSNPSFLDEGWSFHANLGYLNHNDVGKELSKNTLAKTPGSMSSELLIGAGMRFPAGNFDFSAELNARTFLTRPPEAAYSREFVSYLTGGVYYKPYRWLTFEMGLDIRLFSGEDVTDYTLVNRVPDFPNYPVWRGQLGVKINLLPTSYFKVAEKSKLERKAADRQRMLERLMQGDQQGINADDELNRVRTEREKVESELRRLRKLLEQEKKKKKKIE